MESEQTSVLRPLILVAEDDDSNFKLIKAIIGKKCDIEWAKNGEEMVQLFQEHQHIASAILMDIKMPLMNGLEATKIIRESNTEIPIIMQTAYAFSSDKENAMKAGATEVLVKPITLSILRTTLSKYLPDLQWYNRYLKRINRVELRDRYRLVEIGYHKAHLKNEIGGLYGRSIFLFFPFIFFRSRLLLEFCFIIGVDY